MQQLAEDQEVNPRVQQRSQHLPELSELGLGVHGDVARGRERDDEVHTAPQLAHVLRDGWPLGTRPKSVLQGVLGQQRTFCIGRDDAHIVALQRPWPGKPPAVGWPPCAAAVPRRRLGLARVAIWAWSITGRPSLAVVTAAVLCLAGRRFSLAHTGPPALPVASRAPGRVLAWPTISSVCACELYGATFTPRLYH